MSDDDIPESDEGLIGDDDFREAFGEDLSTILDIDTWDTGLEWERALERFKQEIASAVGQEERLRSILRREILPLLGKEHPDMGVYQALPDELTAIHEGLLFPGRVEAVDGICVTHDSLPIDMTQIGIAAASYGGHSATFSQRIFRKEMSARGVDAFAEALSLIERRDNRPEPHKRDKLSDLARRGIMTYAERRVLVDKLEAEWRMGHGNPCPLELLTGSGHMRLLEASLEVLRRLIQQHRKFVFVPSALRDRGLLTLGHALAAGEYALIKTLENASLRIVEEGTYGGRYREHALAFVRECCPEVIMGLFRASERSPPYLFYAHREHVHIAARVALADSILRRERGFPMLLDVADVTCRGAFGSEGFLGLVHDAYSRAGANLQYFNARQTRR